MEDGEQLPIVKRSRQSSCCDDEDDDCDTQPTGSFIAEYG
jgi:hypothetical protein